MLSIWLFGRSWDRNFLSTVSGSTTTVGQIDANGNKNKQAGKGGSCRPRRRKTTNRLTQISQQGTPTICLG